MCRSIILKAFRVRDFAFPQRLQGKKIKGFCGVQRYTQHFQP